jgi:hypothetical protein
MNKTTEALKMAIDWFERPQYDEYMNDVLDACKEALDTKQVCKNDAPACPECGGNGAGGEHEEDCSKLQPTQEPVAYSNKDEMQELKDGMAICYMYAEPLDYDCIPLYTHPHQDGTSPSGARDKEFVTLTDDEIWKIHDTIDSDNWAVEFARAIEQALKEKNG